MTTNVAKHYELGDIWEVSLKWTRVDRGADGTKTTKIIDSYDGPALLVERGLEDNVFNKKTGEVLITRNFITLQWVKDGKIQTVSNFHDTDLVRFIGKGSWKLENWMEG